MMTTIQITVVVVKPNVVRFSFASSSSSVIPFLLCFFWKLYCFGCHCYYVPSSSHYYQYQQYQQQYGLNWVNPNYNHHHRCCCNRNAIPLAFLSLSIGRHIKNSCNNYNYNRNRCNNINRYNVLSSNHNSNNNANQQEQRQHQSQQHNRYLHCSSSIHENILKQPRKKTFPLLFFTTSSKESNNEYGNDNDSTRDDYDDDTLDGDVFNDYDEEEEVLFLRRELEHLERLDDVLKELEVYDYELRMKGNLSDVDEIMDNDFSDVGVVNDDDIDIDTDNDYGAWMVWDEQSLEELLGGISDNEYDDYDDFDDSYRNNTSKSSLTNDPSTTDTKTTIITSTSLPSRRKVVDERNSISSLLSSTKIESIPTNSSTTTTAAELAFARLEYALLQGVVPVTAAVTGSITNDGLPGDFGFDPLNLASKDLFLKTQQWILNFIPEKKRESIYHENDEDDDDDDDDNDIRKEKHTSTSTSTSSTISTSTSSLRPRALILRDYREAEIRHGRLAMLAAIFWPLQEMLDRLLLDTELLGSGGPLFLQPITLPYFPLLMTAIMLLLGYLDIYSQAIKDMDGLGEAFLPGDCFWDPLQILQGTSARTKRNMQERELFNGRAAMIAIASYLLEEFSTGNALVDIPNNALLLQPPFQVPYIQEWLDAQFT